MESILVRCPRRRMPAYPGLPVLSSHPEFHKALRAHLDEAQAILRNKSYDDEEHDSVYRQYDDEDDKEVVVTDGDRRIDNRF